MKKHPAVKAWESWIKSDEGQDCLKPGAMNPHLKNSLWKAFMAGAAVDRPEAWKDGPQMKEAKT